ncbi:hypothetical protein XSR1_10102 [Xenorhabdus szentirmaii DSM 16338]|uniref:Uncharacterized protein n=1 Tax=Xenorhabdus szentirmaii DSM 16338 TaxID=1427518 RepID=W1IQ52_9GAMM|nr:hypothetical protein XSR1_10102 [Xenorhabdus szentirmaii DSM 16338]
MWQAMYCTRAFNPDIRGIGFVVMPAIFYLSQSTMEPEILVHYPLSCAEVPPHVLS